MLCYRDTTYCKDSVNCVTENCSYRLLEEHCLDAARMGLPIAWLPMKAVCQKWEGK